MQRRSTTRGRQGDHLVQDDRSGFTIWASDSRRQWNGVLVHKSLYETRHPQDFVRARRENLRVDPTRPARAIEDEPFSGAISTAIIAAVGGVDNNRVAPMGALGEYALGQGEEYGEEFNQAAVNAAGSFDIQVESTAGMTDGDRIGVLLDNADLFLVNIFEVAGPIRLVLDAQLPASVSAGNRVFDYTASTAPSLT